ncbi:MAG: D-glycero-beta-D-manno-heptose 1-phosphate adenylyltransferase [Candidatus Zixiibacteriota bacterium]
MRNLLTLHTLTSTLTKLRRARKKVVFTNGVFDILHRGHVEYLRKARSYGDVLIVGLNSDSSVFRLKGAGRPVQPQMDRAAILLSLEAVDYVFIFGDDTPEKLIHQVRPDVLVKGADYTVANIVGSDFVRTYGGKIRRIRLTPGRSTTDVIKRLRQPKG